MRPCGNRPFQVAAGFFRLKNPAPVGVGLCEPRCGQDSKPLRIAPGAGTLQVWASNSSLSADVRQKFARGRGVCLEYRTLKSVVTRYIAFGNVSLDCAQQARVLWTGTVCEKILMQGSMRCCDCAGTQVTTNTLLLMRGSSSASGIDDLTCRNPVWCASASRFSCITGRTTTLVKIGHAM